MSGSSFEQLAYTLDISYKGARLGGICTQLKLGEEVDVQYKHQRATFRVAWVGRPGTPTGDQAGVECVDVNKYIWLEMPNQNYRDAYSPPPGPASGLAGKASPSAEKSAGLTDCSKSPLLENTLAEGPGLADSGSASTDSGYTDVAPGDGLAALHVGRLESEIHQRQLSTNAALELIAESVRRLTGATGAAIALAEDTEVMVCLASSGCAPQPGLRFRIEAGISAECAKTGMPMVCEDTETDTRVDADLCRSLGIRCGIVVPLRGDRATLGLIEAFGTEPRLFGSAHVSLLEQIAELTARLLVAVPLSVPPSLGEMR